MQIEKLRSRLVRAGKTTTEYRMTVVEARALLEEIDLLKKQLEEKPKTVVQVIQPPVDHSPKILDGGSFV